MDQQQSEAIVGFPYSYVASADLDSSGNGEFKETTPEFDILVTHIAVAVYDQDGAVERTLAVRDEILVQIKNDGSGNLMSNEPIDIFSLADFSQSRAFKPFIIPQKKAIKVSFSRSDFVNGGTPLLSGAVRAAVIFHGRKV